VRDILRITMGDGHWFHVDTKTSECNFFRLGTTYLGTGIQLGMLEQNSVSRVPFWLGRYLLFIFCNLGITSVPISAIDFMTCW